MHGIMGLEGAKHHMILARDMTFHCPDNTYLIKLTSY